MELTVNELPTPIIRYAGKIPCFTLTEAARFLAKSEADIPRIHNQLKGAAQRGLMRHRLRDGAGKTSPAYFGIDDIAVAVGVLFPLFDFGVSNATVAEYASRACYAWDDMFNVRPDYIPEHISPITAALIGADKGDPWAFELNDFYCDQTGKRWVVAKVYNMETPPVPAPFIIPPSYLSRVTLTIQLGPLLRPLNRVFKRRSLN